MHLPSNSSESYYPNNTMAEYITRLSKSVDLRGEWSVGLYEILYSKTFYNLDENVVFQISLEDVTNVESNFKIFKNEIIRCYFRKGFYASGEDLVKEFHHGIQQSVRFIRNMYYFQHEIDAQIVNKQASSSHNWPVLSFNNTNNKLTATLPRGISLYFPDKLRNYLGFRRTLFSTIGINKPYKVGDVAVHEAESTINLNEGLETFYVYCDILENIRVGHTEAPLLRIIDVGDEAQGRLVKRRYDFPLYVPIQKKNFEQIEIKLLTDQGKPVPFNTGRVILTLHFKKDEDNYLL